MKLRNAVENTVQDVLHCKTSCTVFSTAFLNFISDHYTVTLRLAPHGTEFVKDDKRLITDDKHPVENQKLAHQPLTPGTIRKKSQIKGGQTPKKLRSKDYV